MRKQRYTNMVALLPVIEGMPVAGMRHSEIEDRLGLKGDRPVHNLLNRQFRADRPNTKWVTDIPYMGAFCAVRTNWGNSVRREGVAHK